jgi:hypothetical protein
MPKKRKRKAGAGRPYEGREKLTCYPKPETVAAIRGALNETDNTLGKALDRRYGFAAQRPSSGTAAGRRP